MASYVWSHIQSVIHSEDPSLFNLRELLTASDFVAGVPDPVWYDPRRHSRHLAYTVHLDPRTSLTVTGDVAWGRYSPAPRALYCTVALHHDGDTHQLAQVSVYVYMSASMGGNREGDLAGVFFLLVYSFAYFFTYGSWHL